MAKAETGRHFWKHVEEVFNKTSEQIPRFDFKKTSVISVLRR